MISLRNFLRRASIYRVYPVESDKKTLHSEFWEVRVHQLSRTPELALVMIRFSCPIAAKSHKTAVGRAIGVAHQKNLLSLMQPDGHPHLLQNEIALEVVPRRSQRLCPAGDYDHVWPQDPLML